MLCLLPVWSFVTLAKCKKIINPVAFCQNTDSILYSDLISRLASRPVQSQNASSSPTTPPALESSKEIFMTGIQPCDDLHLGNFYGCLTKWNFIKQKEKLFLIADLHREASLSHSPQKIKLQDSIIQTAALVLSCGLQEKDNIIFVQSSVPHHMRLMWLIACLTPLKWMLRVPTIKNYKQSQDRSMGSAVYPILMAADILLYGTRFVVAGPDQSPHIEFTRRIARKLNSNQRSATTIFHEPQLWSCKSDNRLIYNLKTAEQKMSKSDPNRENSIYLLDSADKLWRKIKNATTHSLPLSDVLDFPVMPPTVKNLIHIFAMSKRASTEIITQTLKNRTWAEFKSELYEALLDELKPIQEKYRIYSRDKKWIFNVLSSGSEKATLMAQERLRAISSNYEHASTLQNMPNICQNE